MYTYTLRFQYHETNPIAPYHTLSASTSLPISHNIPSHLSMSFSQGLRADEDTAWNSGIFTFIFLGGRYVTRKGWRGAVAKEERMLAAQSGRA